MERERKRAAKFARGGLTKRETRNEYRYERRTNTSDGGPLGSRVDEGRGQTRELCELQNTQIIDVPNVHDGRKSNGQVRFSVKTQLLTSQERENAENLFELLLVARLALAECPDHRYWAVAAHERAESRERRRTHDCDLKSSWTTRRI